MCNSIYGFQSRQGLNAFYAYPFLGSVAMINMGRTRKFVTSLKTFTRNAIETPVGWGQPDLSRSPHWPACDRTGCGPDEDCVVFWHRRLVMGAQTSRTDFEWVYTQQPHVTRRKLILRKLISFSPFLTHTPPPFIQSKNKLYSLPLTGVANRAVSFPLNQ